MSKQNQLRELTASDNTLNLCNIYLEQMSIGQYTSSKKPAPPKRFKQSSCQKTREKLPVPLSLKQSLANLTIQNRMRSSKTRKQVYGRQRKLNEIFTTQECTIINSKGFETTAKQMKSKKEDLVQRVRPEEIENKMFSDLMIQHDLYLKRGHQDYLIKSRDLSPLIVQPNKVERPPTIHRTPHSDKNSLFREDSKKATKKQPQELFKKSGSTILPLALIKERLQKTIEPRKAPCPKNNSTKRVDCNPNDAPIVELKEISKQKQEETTPRQKLKSTQRRNVNVKKNQSDYNDEYVL